MSFANPLALVLLLAIPFVIYIGWPRYAFRRRRDSLSLGLRVIIVLLLALGLAGAQISRAADRLAVIFLVDVSDSIGAGERAAQIEYMREALDSMGPDDLAGIVVFGADAIPERPASPVRELAELRATPNTGHTDLAAAIRLGLAMFPVDAARRMVILSDGRPTIGDTEAAARLAAAAGVELSYVPFTRQAGPEVQLSDLRVPASVTAGQPFDLALTIDADLETPATVTVFAAGALIQRQEVTLRPGSNNYTLTIPGMSAGFRDFRAQVDPVENDTFYQNNQLATFSQVIGPPRALVISADSGDVVHLLPALAEAGIEVDQAAPESLPVGLTPLAQYDSVILVDVPATRLAPRRMEILERYVRDLGRGLVFVGGPDSYGPGGYFQTPLERTLPVETQIRDQERLPQLTLVYIIDRSGSMGVVSASGVTNMDLAKEAIIRSIDFLQPTDRAGLISFDTEGYWIANVQPVFDRVALQRLTATLRPGGGTDILAGLRLAADALMTDPSPRKHIILLTDGIANPRGLIELTSTLRSEAEVTTSVIAMGPGAAPFLADMAAAGDGNYHIVNDVETIPTIFTLETVLATRSYIIEEPFVPGQSALSPILDGITTAPPLLGYVATTPKQTAQVILSGPDPFNDPVLASWQYGLGRAVAFTSDATGRWGVNWVDWADFTRFWGQAVRWTITEGAANNLETRVQMEGESARVIVDARDDAGGFLNGLALEAAIVNPDLNTRNLTLRQVAPGRYEATFIPDGEGAYFLGVSAAGADGTPLAQSTGWVMSYSAEYDMAARGANLNLLSEIAALSGGRDLSADPAQVFAHNLVARSAAQPIWPPLLLAALLLLPFDIAARRIIITATDMQRLRQWLGVSRGPALATEPSSERLSSLMGAKERGRQRAEGDSAADLAATLRSRLGRPRPNADAEADLPPSASGGPSYRSPQAPTRRADPDAGSTASALLKRRRERRSDEDQP